MPRTTLDLLAPRLPPLLTQGDAASADVPISRWLRRASPNATPGETTEECLLALFGLVTRDGDAPAAPYLRLNDLGDCPPGWWLLASPVYLRPDRDRLLMFGDELLGVTAAEAAELVGLFNAHFAEEGLALEVGAPGRWYLRLDAPPRLATTALGQALGRHIRPALPTGEEGRLWQRRMSEAQILFHHAPANERREAQGLPPINGLWFSGGGEMHPIGPRYDRVLALHPLACGLARASGCRPAPPELEAELGERTLVVLDGPDCDLAQLQGWIGRLDAGLRRGRPDLVRLFTADGQVREVTRRTLRPFWFF